MTRQSVLDVSPASVRGAISASKARVVWDGGYLFVFTPNDDKPAVEIVTCAERPTNRGREYTAATIDGEVTFAKGCGCGGNPLRRFQRRALMALVE